jgi:hypothetical protein
LAAIATPTVLPAGTEVGAPGSRAKAAVVVNDSKVTPSRRIPVLNPNIFVLPDTV